MNRREILKTGLISFASFPFIEIKECNHFYNIDLSNHNIDLSNHKHHIVLNKNIKLTISGEEDVMFLKLEQDSVGGRKVIWPSNIDWCGGYTPAISLSANTMDFFQIIKKTNSYFYDGFIIAQGLEKI